MIWDLLFEQLGLSMYLYPKEVVAFSSCSSGFRVYQNRVQSLTVKNPYHFFLKIHLFPFLKHLLFECPHVPKEVITCVLTACPRLNQLDLSFCGIRSRDMKYITRRLEPHQYLEELNLSCNHLYESSVFLTKLLNHLPRLKRLYLDDSCIYPAEKQEILERYKFARQLEILSFG